jgi:hypothetical protein
MAFYGFLVSRLKEQALPLHPKAYHDSLPPHPLQPRDGDPSPPSYLPNTQTTNPLRSKASCCCGAAGGASRGRQGLSLTTSSWLDGGTQGAATCGRAEKGQLASLLDRHSLPSPSLAQPASMQDSLPWRPTLSPPTVQTLLKATNRAMLEQ